MAKLLLPPHLPDEDAIHLIGRAVVIVCQALDLRCTVILDHHKNVLLISDPELDLVEFEPYIRKELRYNSVIDPFIGTLVQEMFYPTLTAMD